MRKILALPFHPILFGLMRVLHVLSENVDHLPFRDSVRSFLVIPAATLAVWGVLYLFVRHAGKTALLTTVLVGWFLVSGDLFESLPVTVVVSTIVICGVGAFVVRTSYGFEHATRFLNVTALLVVSFAMANVVQSMAGDDFVPFDRVETTGAELAAVAVEGNKPNFYYIVLDGYGRTDVLKEFYGFDNGAFLNDLEAMGFYVAHHARANYPQTMLSLASSLNLAHLPDFVNANGETETHDRSLLIRALRRNRVLDFFERLGYTTITVSSGVQATEFYHFDVRYEPRFAFNEFESALLHNTILMRFLDQRAEGREHSSLFYDLHRQRIRFSLDALEAIPQTEGPKFAFVHILCPHPPFVFNRDGAPWDPGVPTGSFMERTKNPEDRQAYIEGYSEQVRFVTERLKTAIATIRTRDPDAVVLLQSDHGPAAMINWENPQEMNMKERFSILSAFYVPGGCGGALYESITPVNSFRAVFNSVFGTALPMLPDVSYFSPIEAPYAFEEVAVE